MAYTLVTFAQEHNVSIESLSEALDALGTTIFRPNGPLNDRTLRICREALDLIASRRKPVPRPAPTPTPIQRSASTPRPASTVTASRAADAVPQYVQLLSRDYIIFTETALWKPKAAGVIMTILDLIRQGKSASRIVMLNAALEQLEDSEDEVRQNFAKAARMMANSGYAELLDGDIAREQSKLTEYISARKPTESILLLCGSPAMIKSVTQRNRALEKTDGYIPVVYRDIDHKGHVVSYSKRIAAFAPMTGQRPMPNGEDLAPVSGEIPEEGSYVLLGDGRARVRLDASLGKGAEASVYRIENGRRCVKIFNRNALTKNKVRKVELMCEKYRQIQGDDSVILQRVAWPQELVFNESGSLVGFAMTAFSDVTPFSHYSARSFPKLIPGVTKTHQINMAISFVEVIDFLHRQNVVLCDINNENLLFDSRQRAFLVDLDSAQIMDELYYYPSNTYVPQFLPPERIGRELTGIRERADDVWIVQMLLFAMITPCGNPYATTDQSVTGDEAIRQGVYPYQSGRRNRNGAASTGANNIIGGLGGPWHMMFANLLPEMKNAFWDSFHHDGTFFAREKRRPTGFWLAKLLNYQRALPRFTKYDPNRNEFMPKAFPRHEESDSAQPGAARKMARQSASTPEDIIRMLQGMGNMVSFATLAAKGGRP